MIAQGVLAEVKRFGNDLVRCAFLAHNGRHYFALGGGEVRVSRLFALRSLPAGKRLQDSTDHGPIEPRLARMHPCNGFENHLGRLRFVDDAARARDNCAFVRSGVADTGKNEHCRLARQMGQKIKPAFGAKFEVEQHYMRPVLFHGRKRFAMAGRYICQLELWTGRFNELRQPPQNATVMVNQQYPDRLSSKNGHKSPRNSCGNEPPLFPARVLIDGGHERYQP